MNYRIIFTCFLFVVVLYQLGIGQQSKAVNMILPTNLSPSFPSSGYPFTKRIDNCQTFNQKKDAEKQLLPINGKFEFLTSSQIYGFYSFLIREDDSGKYFIDIRHLPNKSLMSYKDSIDPFLVQNISSQLVDRLIDVCTFFIHNFKSKEVSVVCLDGIGLVFRCIIGEEYWTFTAMNPTGGEFLELTNICYGIIRDCSTNKFSEKECIKQLANLKEKYIN